MIIALIIAIVLLTVALVSVSIYARALLKDNHKLYESWTEETNLRVIAESDKQAMMDRLNTFVKPTIIEEPYNLVCLEEKGYILLDEADKIRDRVGTEEFEIMLKKEAIVGLMKGIEPNIEFKVNLNLPYCRYDYVARIKLWAKR